MGLMVLDIIIVVFMYIHNNGMTLSEMCILFWLTESIAPHLLGRVVSNLYFPPFNLIFDKEVVRELIQHDCNPSLIREELNSVLKGGHKRDFQLKEYDKLIDMLGNGSASEKVATFICH